MPCLACLAIPLAAVGVGSAASGDRKSDKKKKKRMFWGGCGLIILSIAILAYLYMNPKSCKKCNIK